MDDPSFGSPIQATLDGASSTWSAPLGELARGEHTMYARAVRDGTSSEVASSTFTVASPATVQWQIVARNGPTDPAAWQTASGFESWSFGFDTAAYSRGTHTIVTRVVHGDVDLARKTASVKFN